MHRSPSPWTVSLLVTWAVPVLGASPAPPAPPGTTPASAPPSPAQAPPPPAAEPGAPAAAAPPPPAAAPPPASPAAPPPPAPPVAASAPAPSVPPPSQPTVVLTLPPPPTDAVVHLAVNYPNAVLEGRSRVDGGDFVPLCQAPCDRAVRVEATEVRVAAPGMTTSNVFSIDPGAGVARFRVSGGSSSLRTVGLATLLTGLPVSFGGMTLFALSAVSDDKTERSAGIATLAVGAVLTLASVPLLLAGATSVNDARNKDIATTPSPTPLF